MWQEDSKGESIENIQNKGCKIFEADFFSASDLNGQMLCLTANK